MTKKKLFRHSETPQTFNAGSKATSLDGYSEAKERTELAGYWIPDAGPIHGKLIEAFQYIQKSGKGRGQTRVMYVIDLLEPCVARVKAQGGLDEDTLEPRSLVGVMSSMGLRHLVQYGGCFVRIERTGKKTLGNGNEMWSYKVAFKGKPRTLDVRPPFVVDEPNSTFSNGRGREPGEDDAQDELPF